MKKVIMTMERANRLDMWHWGLFYKYEIRNGKAVFYYDERIKKREPNLVKPT